MKTQAQLHFEEKMKLFSENTVINWHDHIWGNIRQKHPEAIDEQSFDRLMFSIEKNYFDYTLISIPVVVDQFCTPEAFRSANDLVAEACRRAPQLLGGMCFVNPGYGQQALDEISRCYDMGFAGIKLYHQYQLNDPVQYPIIEKAIKLDMPILMHAGKLTNDEQCQPRISHGEYFAEVAQRYPEANLIMAHITGGGDWHWQLKAMEKSKNVVLDMSGSVIDCPVIEECVSRLGAERVLFGTDGSVSAGVGKMLAAQISEDEKKTILAGKAYARFLKRR